MKTINNKKKGAAVLITAAILAVVFTGCPNNAGGSGSGSATPPAPPEIVYEFVDIQGATITGVDHDYTLPGNEDYWKGVFRAGRKVKLSPYKLGKTEVTYKLWKEVYDWAVKAENGYKFANEGVKGSDGTGNDEEQPVTTISWRDCIVWCDAYTEKRTIIRLY